MQQAPFRGRGKRLLEIFVFLLPNKVFKAVTSKSQIHFPRPLLRQAQHKKGCEFDFLYSVCKISSRLPLGVGVKLPEIKFLSPTLKGVNLISSIPFVKFPADSL